jgi:glycosyltransferase involved in cell wall biosynthesis
MEKRKDILIFTDWFYPGFKAGGPVQSVYNLVVFLSDYYKIKVVTRNNDLNDDQAYENIEPNNWIQLDDNIEVLYISKDQLTVKNIKSLVKLNKDNYILINGLFSWKFSILPSYFSLIYDCKHVFLAVRGMLHRSALSVKPFKKQLFLAFARGFGLFKNITLLASSEKEKDEIKMSIRDAKVKMAPNLPCPLIKPMFDGKNDVNVLHLLYLGRIAPEKNTLSVLIALNELNRPCKLTIAGQGYKGTQYYSDFENALKNLNPKIELNLLGNVNRQDLKSVILNSDVMVLPSLGENFGHSIFESFAHSKPVIIGNNTPWNNLESMKAGIEVEPTNIEQLKNAISFFIDLPNEEFIHWQKAAYNTAKSYIENNNFKEVYLNLFS